MSGKKSSDDMPDDEQEDLRQKRQLKNPYADFLHEIQREKMKELWGGKEDEAWENA